MHRRDFVTQTTIGSVGLGAAGCGAGLRRGPGPVAPMSDERGRELAERLDRTLGGLEYLRLVSGEAPEATRRDPRLQTYLEHADPMAKRAVQALVVAAAAKEVPPGTQPPAALHEAIQRRIPLLDEHCVEMAALFDGMPLQERRRIGRALAERPELPLRVADRIDGLGEAAGVGRAGRDNLQRIARTVRFRMAKQSPSAFFDEQVMKVQRVAAHRGVEAHLVRLMATRASTQAVLQTISATVTSGTGTGQALGDPVPPAPAPPAMVELPPQPGPQNPHYRRGTVPASIGGMLLGTGGVLLGVSIPLLSQGIGWAFVVTAGGVIALGGVVLLIVGAILAATR